MHVFNLSEEAVKRCKVLISVSYVNPPILLSISAHSLYSHGTDGGGGWVFQGRTHIHREKANKLQLYSMKEKENAYICIN